MSMRPADDDVTPLQNYAGIASLNTSATAHQLREDIEVMRAMQSADGFGAETNTMATVNDALQFDQLTETEKSAASIGASPEEWKPISWMNQSHYNTLLKKNALGGRLTQQIEAYKVIAGVDASGMQMQVA